MITATRLDAFRQEIEKTGLVPPATIIADGKLHRFASNGDRADDAGWYTYFPDEPQAGVFGCWRTGLKQTWSSKTDSTLTPVERERQRVRFDDARRQREQDERLRHADAAERAQRLWDGAKPAPADHPYLIRKGVQPHGLRVDGNGRLIVPVMIGGSIASLQTIDANSGKGFLRGGAVKSGSYTIGDPTEATTVLICEGFATGASLHEAAGLPVVVAFSAANLTSVAEKLRQQLPTATIVVCGDNDLSGTGQRAAREAAKAVSAVVALPEEQGQDFNDVHVQHGLDAIKEAITTAIRREEMRTMNTAVATAEADIDPWPQLDEAAIRGVMGDLVCAIEPHSEADPVAILVQAFIAFGNVLNRSAHFRAEADRHYLNLNAVLVGETSKGRKGTSWGHVKQVFAAVDQDWVETRVLNGLSSGEGLIWAVRDPIFKDEPVRDNGKPTGECRRVLIDQGVTDKRLLVLESEFAGTLRVMARKESILSVVIRQAFDSVVLRTMTKNSPAQATEAHISIIGHITRDELCRLIESTEANNGFCNRFLWVCVKRSKVLPEGGQFDASSIAPLIQRLHEAVRFGRGLGELKRDEAARDNWRTVYSDLSEGKPGLLGAVVSRGEALVMRLACLYAIQDMSYVVGPEHLRAALALWEYCEASARYIFGQRLGDPVADELLSALRKHHDGMTRTEIRDLFGRNRKAHEIDRGLTLLAAQGLTRKEMSQSGGRPIERWFAVSRATIETTNTTKVTRSGSYVV